MALDYYYNEQIRRYLLQFTRIFGGFQYGLGRDASGQPSYKTIPVTLATANRQIGHLMRNNSENTMNSTPQISCWIQSIKRVPQRIQDPNYVRSSQVFERAIDPLTNKYTSDLGKTYTVQSYMPVPYDLMMQVDIWTSNELQKHQILEQILVLFNPSIDLQTGTNPLDWSSLTIVELQDITWSSRNYPIGTDNEIDMATLTFRVPIWLNPPSKLKKQNIIQQIVIDIGNMDTMAVENGEGFYWSDNDLFSRMIVTPGDYSIKVMGNTVTLLSQDASTHDQSGNLLSWITLLSEYGRFRNNISQIRLKPRGVDLDDNTHDVIGILSLNPQQTNQLLMTLDIGSLKANTLAAINGSIDPLKTFPGKGLPTPNIGDRYLLLNSIPSGPAWGGFVAHENDIVEFNSINGGTPGWQVSFNSKNSTSPEYVLNNSNAVQLFWTGEMWILSVDGQYDPGYWRLNL